MEKLNGKHVPPKVKWVIKGLGNAVGIRDYKKQILAFKPMAIL
jgi:hypothetical protein